MLIFARKNKEKHRNATDARPFGQGEYIEPHPDNNGDCSGEHAQTWNKAEGSGIQNRRII